jgi:hypothetical protein
VSADLGPALRYSGRTDEAVVQYERSLKLDPKHGQREWVDHPCLGTLAPAPQEPVLRAGLRFTGEGAAIDAML